MIEAKLRLAEALGGALTRAALPSLGDGVTVSALTRLTAGAANETWRFEATGASGKQTCILRRAPFVAEAAPEDSQNLGKAGEARVQAAARQAGVPAAEVFTVLTEADGLGEGYLMAALEGETLPRKILRDEVYALII